MHTSKLNFVTKFFKYFCSLDIFYEKLEVRILRNFIYIIVYEINFDALSI